MSVSAKILKANLQHNNIFVLSSISKLADNIVLMSTHKQFCAHQCVHKTTKLQLLRYPDNGEQDNKCGSMSENSNTVSWGSVNHILNTAA